MTTNDDYRFDTWLDDFVAGRSTPASRTASTSENAAVRDAARQFHGLARLAERNIGTDLPIATLPTNWKDFMSMQIVETGPELASPSPCRHTVSHPGSYRGERWHVAFNLALAALLILTIGTGIWRATDGFNGPNGGDSSGSDQQSAFAPETREWTPEPSDATPDLGEELPLLPTAEECTVEPLTIDEVLWYVEDPGGASRSREMEQSATPDPNVESVETEPTEAPDGSFVDGQLVSTPGAKQDPSYGEPLIASPSAAFAPRPASPEQLAAIAGVQRMWMACVLADSPLQRWALESPELVAEQVQVLLPTFADRAEARAILEEVEATRELKPSDDFWRQPNASYVMITSRGFPALDTVALVDPAGVPSWTIDGRTFEVGYIWYNMEDGAATGSGAMPATATPPADAADKEPEFSVCDSFELTWFQDRADLLVSRYPSCG